MNRLLSCAFLVRYKYSRLQYLSSTAILVFVDYHEFTRYWLESTARIYIQFIVLWDHHKWGKLLYSKKKVFVVSNSVFLFKIFLIYCVKLYLFFFYFPLLNYNYKHKNIRQIYNCFKAYQKKNQSYQLVKCTMWFEYVLVKGVTATVWQVSEHLYQC